MRSAAACAVGVAALGAATLLALPQASRANEWGFSLNEFVSPALNNKLYGGIEVWGDNVTGGQVSTSVQAQLDAADGVYW